MPKFSKVSAERLATCDVRLQQLFYEVIQEVDCSILCGHRTKEEQQKAFENGFSKVKYPNSRHNTNPSKAVDAAPWPIDWTNTKRFEDFATIVKKKAVELGIEVVWGGDFKSFKDMPHWELKGD